MKDSNTRVYTQDHGPALYRRSMYTFWKRTAPPPTLEILNAPSREVFCTRRDRTDTPLQAFVTLNDPQFIEASRNLAEAAMSVGDKFDARLDFISEKLLARVLKSEERQVMRHLLEQSLSHYKGSPAEAKSLLEVGESKTGEKSDPIELASWTLVASDIMNLDESLTK
jgi:hypothetical protein